MGLCSHPQPPLVQTQTVTIKAVSNTLTSGITTTEIPIVPTKTFTYESSKVGAPAPAQPRSVSAILHGEDGSTSCTNKQVWEDQARGSKITPSLQEFSIKLFFSLFFWCISQVNVDGTDEDNDDTTFSSSKTITSETTSGTTVTTTTTHISKVSNANRALAFFALFYFIWFSIIFFLSSVGSEKWIFRDSCGEENCHNCRF